MFVITNSKLLIIVCHYKHMTIEEIKRIIADQREEIIETYQRQKIIPREMSKQQLLSYLSHPNVLTILGVRRSGKSVLSTLLLKDKTYGYLNFDDERLVGIKTNELNLIIQAFYELYTPDLDYIVFDEIQNVDHWELFVNRLRRTKKIIITGSNSNLLSGELASHLTGRHIDFTLFPFSFREFLLFTDKKLLSEKIYSTKKIAHIRKLLEEYIKLGGFPEVYKFGKAILMKTYEDILQKDILLRYTIKNQTTFKELAKYVISQFSSEISYTKLKNISSIKNVHTVKNYLDYLSSSYLIFIIERFSFSLKNQAIAPKKVYCIDTGILNAISFQFSENSGRIMENLVAIELLRRKAYNTSESELYYWKDHQQREVDFVVKKGKKVTQLIQVTRSFQKEDMQKRECQALLRAAEQLKCSNLLIITWDYEGIEKINGKTLLYIPLWKWLLE